MRCSAAAIAALAASVTGCNVISGVGDLSFGGGRGGGSLVSGASGTSTGAPTASGSSGSGGEGVGGAGAEVLAEWIAGEPAADFTYELPAWLELVSPSPDRTSQTSASSLRVGYGPGQPRARNVGGGWGLSIESARTNVVEGSIWGGPTWQTGTMTVTSGVADPAAGLDGTLYAAAADKKGDRSDVNGGSGGVASTWGRGVEGLAPFTHVALFENCCNAVVVDVTSDEWSRVSVMSSQVKAIGVTQEKLGGADGIAGASAFELYGAQVERDAAYPSSLIPTTGLERTREAEVLSSPTPGVLAPGGYFDVTLVVAPAYATGEAAVDHNLLYLDPSNRLTLRAVEHVVSLSVQGSALSSAPLVWARDQPLTIHARNTPLERTLTIAGATSGDGSSVSSVTGAAAPAQRLYVLGAELGAQECADLRRLTFLAP